MGYLSYLILTSSANVYLDFVELNESPLSFFFTDLHQGLPSFINFRWVLQKFE